MSLTWCKHYLLSCLVVSLGSADLSTCNEPLYNALKYCGNREIYKKYSKDQNDYTEYRHIGRFCYAEVTTSLRWHQSQDRCKNQSAKLAEFHKESDWNEYVSGIDDKVYKQFWIGGRKRTLQKQWIWISDEAWITHFQWYQENFPDDIENERCILVRVNLWDNRWCNIRSPYLCQKLAKEAYEKRATIKIFAAKDGSGNLRLGQETKLSCSARTEEDLVMTIKTSKEVFNVEYDYKAQSQRIDKIDAYNIREKLYFFYEDQRCFRQYELSTIVKLSTHLEQALITCKRKKTSHESLETSFTLFLKPHTNVKIYNISEAIMNGSETISECDIFRVTCTGFGVKKSVLTFQVVNDNKKHEWMFDSSLTEELGLPNWAQFNWVEEIDADLFGNSFKITTSITVTPKMAKARFVCANAESEYAMMRDSAKIDLNVKVNQNLPPILTSHRHRTFETKVLTLTCKTYVGKAEFHSWEIIVPSVATRYVRVGRAERDVSIPFPWLKVTQKTDSGSRDCGNPIISELVAFSGVPKSQSVTFRCFSYDHLNKASISSKYSRADLAATFALFVDRIGKEEGEEKDGETGQEQQGIELYSLWFVVLIVAGFVVPVVIYFLTGRGKAKIMKRNKSKNDKKLSISAKELDKVTTSVLDDASVTEVKSTVAGDDNLKIPKAKTISTISGQDTASLGVSSRI